MGCIYLITNAANGKQYAGIDTCSDDGSHRWQRHLGAARRGRGHLLANAIRKYGPEAFTIHSLAHSNDEVELCHWECAAIRRFNCKSPHGYNMTDGGDGVINPSDESRAKLSASMKRAYQAPEIRARLSLSLRRAYEDPTYRAKLSAHAKRIWQDPARLSKMRGPSNPAKTPEARAKMSARSKLAWQNPEHRAKFTGDNSHIKRPEVRAKISASHRARYPNPTPAQLKRWARADARRAARRKAQLMLDQVTSIAEAQAGKGTLMGDALDRFPWGIR